VFNGGEPVGKVEDELKKWIDKHRPAAIQLVVLVYEAPSGAGGDVEKICGVEAAYGRFQSYLSCVPKAPVDHLKVLPAAKVLQPAPDHAKRYAGLRIRAHNHLGLVPGEHGFRFFPGFYRHLRDTMRRTPLHDPDTGKTALDNLTEVKWQVVADEERNRPAAFIRKPQQSIGTLVEQYQRIRRELGYRPSDVLRFMLRIARYAISSSERREMFYGEPSA
jgi:hypothetical protein